MKCYTDGEEHSDYFDGRFSLISFNVVLITHVSLRITK